MCYYLDGTVNLYMRPIEGITVIFYLDEMKIKDYSDRSMVPVRKADGTDYRESKQKPPSTFKGDNSIASRSCGGMGSWEATSD
ncbi:amine oxidase [copper-containing] alpha 3, peroxisomal-like isoform X2 [Cornus florida]|uniref:amine oxidase [copper-containing] alpha 3, peroxisomal-like isoform X2 n=1 Tax=Cornus florida TaxID=4283 RepID=UPI002898E7C7|nr:amine oxidase [copper-containing] alpha 3, peroxisomal-like isoform X2 [Cornus florida]